MGKGRSSPDESPVQRRAVYLAQGYLHSALVPSMFLSALGFREPFASQSSSRETELPLPTSVAQEFKCAFEAFSGQSHDSFCCFSKSFPVP